MAYTTKYIIHNTYTYTYVLINLTNNMIFRLIHSPTMNVERIIRFGTHIASLDEAYSICGLMHAVPYRLWLIYTVFLIVLI